MTITDHAWNLYGNHGTYETYGNHGTYGTYMVIHKTQWEPMELKGIMEPMELNEFKKPEGIMEHVYFPSI